jgi:uncharacterized protein with NRDE domain
MCLLTVLFNVHPEAPVVVAGNRDEQYVRPAKPLQILQPAAPRVLGGLDVLAGGTWLAVNEHGVFAGLTNRPAPGGRDPSRRSRGELPLLLADYTGAHEAVKALQKQIHCSEYNSCWLFVGDRQALYYIIIGGNDEPEISRLSTGIHVLENRPLNARSAKVSMIRRALIPAATWLGSALTGEFQSLLGSHEIPASDAGRELTEDNDPRPLQLSATCVHTGRYGTRSATLIVIPPASDSAPRVYYADGPPCTTPLQDASHLWRAEPDAGHGDAHRQKSVRRWPNRAS